MQEETHDNLPEKDILVDGNENLVNTNIDQEVANEAVAIIDDLNAAISEDATIGENHDLVAHDYEAFSMEKLVEELEQLVDSDKIMAVKNQVEEIKRAFLNKYDHFIDEKKEAFKNENPDSVEEFDYNFPLKNKFDSLYSAFRSKKKYTF